MPLCPECLHRWRTLPDEPADECPHCEWTGTDEGDDDDHS